MTPYSSSRRRGPIRSSQSAPRRNLVLCRTRGGICPTSANKRPQARPTLDHAASQRRCGECTGAAGRIISSHNVCTA